MKSFLDNIISKMAVEKYEIYTFEWDISDHQGAVMYFEIINDR